jgi:deferrochelatase/peroxidase EfeB
MRGYVGGESVSVGERAGWSGLPRRVVLAGTGVVVGSGAAAWMVARSRLGSPRPPGDAAAVARQPGVVTLPPSGAVLAAYDVRAGDRVALAAVLRRFSAAVGQAMGRFAGVGRPVEVTVAVGASLFDARFGLGPCRPRGLVDMPAFPNDVLDPARCHGDLLLQVGAADTATARLVVDELAATDLALRWRVEGFRDENVVTDAGRASDRNLFGFREGAGNPDVRDEAEMDRLVWAGPSSGEPVWAVGGTYQVVRVIRFATALWDGEPLTRQEAVFGRRKSDGVPLGGDREDGNFDYRADPSGQSIALDAHIRRANPRTPETAGSRILRRGYSYRAGVDAAGRRDEGMLFVCFQQDVERGFATVQRRLAGEALDRYVLPVGGGYFFVLPGVSGSDGDYLGRTLFDAAG